MKAIEVARDDQRRRQGQRAGLLRRRHDPVVGAGGAARARRQAGGEPDAADHHARLPRARRPRRVHRRAGRVAARADDRRAAASTPGAELGFVFQTLRANDLIWTYVVSNYLKGKIARRPSTCCTGTPTRTNLPGPMYAWYLRNMYLENNLLRAGPADDVRREGRPRQDRHAELCPRDAGRPHRALASRPTARRSCSAARRSSCSAPAATSPASSTRRRRTSAATGPAATPGDDAEAVAGSGAGDPGQLVDALDEVAEAPRRQAGRRAQAARQRDASSRSSRRRAAM